MVLFRRTYILIYPTVFFFLSSQQRVNSRERYIVHTATRAEAYCVLLGREQRKYFLACSRKVRESSYYFDFLVFAELTEYCNLCIYLLC